MRKRLALSIAIALVISGFSSSISWGADAAPLIPKLVVQNAKETDISLRITNYDDSFTWSAKSSAGEVIMDRIGNLSVVNLKNGEKATIVVTASKTGFKTGTATYNGVLGETTEKTVDNVKPTSKPKPKTSPKKVLSKKATPKKSTITKKK